MTMQDLQLMQALVTKMDWIETRQKVLAQNIANADTPGYQPQEVTPVDFSNLLRSSTSSVSLTAPDGVSRGLARTSEAHLGLGGTSGSSDSTDVKKQKKPYEVAPAGNAVVLEEQLLKMNENYTDHRLITNLYQKNVDMLKLSLRSQ